MSTRRALTYIITAVLLALIGTQGGLLDGPSGDRTGGRRSGAAGGFGENVPDRARVWRVVDGDTVGVETLSPPTRRDVVRYIGVDTPESVKPNTPVQCYAKAASAANEQLVDGQTVRLVLDREARDRYGRLLAYVYRAQDGAFVNARLVSGGYARTLTIRPNDRFANRFSVLQNDAQEARRGLWGAC